jgi:glycyl-tRNA synthetase beta chain
VRPVLSILSLLDGEILPFEFDGIRAGNTSCGHPILSPESFTVHSGTEYRQRLAKLGIEVVWNDRRERLFEALKTEADELKGRLEEDPELLEHLSSQLEIPGATGGSFDPDFLNLPEQILLAALRDQHMAFPLRNRDGDLLPLFVTGMNRPDDPVGSIRTGQARALTGRLVDARFHYEADRKHTMAERGRQLEHIAFHSDLGTYAEKTERVLSLAEFLVDELDLDQEREAVGQAGALLKADLTTEMFRDFPRLRGTLGGIYAREEGYVEAVWRAIAEHYDPRSSEGPIPTQPTGQVLAVADRLDTLVGYLGLGLLPRGGKDPNALRRLAQGLLRILLEAGFEFDLDMVAARAVLLYGDALERGAQEILTDLQGFLGDRLTQLLGQRGFNFDEIEAAKAIGQRNLPDLVARIEALRTVREEPDFRSLVLAAKRISNLVDGSQEVEIQADLLVEEAERELAEAVVAVRKDVDLAVSERRYADGLRRIEALVPALDRFFAEVLVMDENESRRTNRLALLQSCRRTFWRVARLKEMVVEKEVVNDRKTEID